MRGGTNIKRRSRFHASSFLTALFLFLSVPAALRAEQITFMPSTQGRLTAWHVAGPFHNPFEPEKFTAGRLPVLGKEKQPWRFTADYAADMDILPRWQTAGYTYLFTRLTGPEKRYVINMIHKLSLRIWLDGKPVRIATRKGRWRSYSLITIDPGREHISILIEVKDSIFAASCDNEDVRQVITAAQTPSVAEAIASSLSVKGSSRGLHPEKPFIVTVEIPGSRVMFDGPIDITITLCRENGKKIDQEEIHAAGIEDLVMGKKISLGTPESHPFYLIKSQVTVNENTAQARPYWTFYINEVYEKAQDAVDKAADFPRGSPFKANLELHAEKLGTLFDDYLFKSSFCRMLKDEFQAAETDMRAAQGLRAPREPGLQEYAYLSEIDDSPQPYLVYVPELYTPKKPAPLVVFLHGYTPYVDKVDWASIPLRLFNIANRKGFLITAPFARGNTDFQGIGEDDVMRVIRLVQREFAVDERKIFLTGMSMGGSGVWTIAAHYPHIFAGAIPISGRNDYLFWHRDKEIPAYADLFCRGDFAYELAENFLNLPVFCIHGEADTLVETEQSRRMVSRLEDLGYNVTYREIPKADHWIWDEAFAIDGIEDWMDSRMLNKSPERITYKTYSTRYHRAYWLDLTRIGQWGRPARVDAVLKEDNSVAIKTENLDALSLLTETTFKNVKKVHVNIDGKEYILSSKRGLNVRLSETSPPEGFPGEKTPDMCGPFREVFSGPLRIVHGKDDEEGIESARTFAEQWRKFSMGRSIVVSDADVDKKTLSLCNLVLVGSMETNKIIERVAGKIPFSIEADSISIAGKSFDRENTGFIAVYPSPMAPDRYIGFVWGEVWGTHLPSNHVWDEVPDFLVFSKKGGTVEVLEAGYFDSNWRIRRD